MMLYVYVFMKTGLDLSMQNVNATATLDWLDWYSLCSKRWHSRVSSVIRLHGEIVRLVVCYVQAFVVIRAKTPARFWTLTVSFPYKIVALVRSANRNGRPFRKSVLKPKLCRVTTVLPNLNENIVTVHLFCRFAFWMASFYVFRYGLSCRSHAYITHSNYRENFDSNNDMPTVFATV